MVLANREIIPTWHFWTSQWMWDVNSGEANSSQCGDEISEFSVGLSKLIEVVAEMKEREKQNKDDRRLVSN